MSKTKEELREELALKEAEKFWKDIAEVETKHLKKIQAAAGFDHFKGMYPVLTFVPIEKKEIKVENGTQITLGKGETID